MLNTKPILNPAEIAGVAIADTSNMLMTTPIRARPICFIRTSLTEVFDLLTYALTTASKPSWIMPRPKAHCNADQWIASSAF
jgi:hypothetical protein